MNNLSLIVLALGWMLAGLMTAAFALLVAQPIFLPECASYAPEGQRAAQAVGVGIVVAMGATWAAAGVALRRARGRTVGRFVLAAALPFALFGVFLGGASVMTVAIDAVADSSDHANCW